jgi:hypothetical protein
MAILESWHCAMGANGKRKAKSPVLRPGFLLVFLGRPCGIRTCDQRIKSPLLYQLS